MDKYRKFSLNEGSKKNGYRLSNQIFQMVEVSQNEFKPAHIALYFWICQLNNKIGWDRPIIGLPTSIAMKMTGMRDRRFYRRILTELDSFGLIRIVKLSTNQYIATQVELLLTENTHVSNNRTEPYYGNNSRATDSNNESNASSEWDDDSLPPMEPIDESD